MDNILSHKSIRRFKDTPVPTDVLEKMLTAATRASTTGNMQVYSIIVTTNKVLLQQLASCHFNQPASTTAPMHITFCVDVNRFSKWCELRGGERSYDNFLWFINGSIDALLASQNLALTAEAQGLGICYLGTAAYSARRISEILEIPKGVIPIAVVVAGYPDEKPPLTDRLPLEAVVHYDKYHQYTTEDIENIWRERESSDETVNLLKINELPNLARIFTEKRYPKKDNEDVSARYIEFLKEQGFL